MLLKDFPDINWLKNQIKNNFVDNEYTSHSQQSSAGWPTVILNATCKKVERQDIKGPFSLFLNQSGKSKVKTSGKEYIIYDRNYILHNSGENYDLVVENQPTETFNIHFGEDLFQKSMHVLSSTQAYLLDNPFSVSSVSEFTPKTMLRSKELNEKTESLKQAFEAGAKPEFTEPILFEILTLLFSEHFRDFKNLNKLSISSPGAKEEVKRRLLIARDFIHAHYNESISLDKLSDICYLSKFHFLRLFKIAFGCSPYQYQKKIRLAKGLELITKTKLPISAIALEIGVENASSLSRMIYQSYGYYPQALRTK